MIELTNNYILDMPEQNCLKVTLPGIHFNDVLVPNKLDNVITW